MGKDFDAKVEKPLQLARNYRSHSGIVLLGTAVVGLLKKHFKESIDHMHEPEHAVLKGSSWSCMLAWKTLGQ